MKHFLNELHDFAVGFFDQIWVFGNVFGFVNGDDSRIIFEKVVLRDFCESYKDILSSFSSRTESIYSHETEG